MRSRLATAALLSLTLAVPAVARVISYAPYTNQAAEPGVSRRTSRWFVLLEGNGPLQRQPVLYDAHGQHEPRVLQPIGPGSNEHRTAAVYEPRHGEPMLLIDGSFSRDGGRTWVATSLTPRSYRDEPEPTPQVDFGGPFARGMHDFIHLGNDAFPFIVNDLYRGVRAVSASGQVQSLFANDLIGANRSGDRFLVRAGEAIYSVSPTGGRSLIVHSPPPADRITGWIAPDGTSYLQFHRGGDAFLYVARRQQLYFVAGPRDASLLPIWLPPDEVRSFAVPTHDYRGAWILQREHGKPTTLLHFDGRELRHQWTDPRGPEVEALIAGDSGETLLVQVHVPRDVNVEMPFVDPALAVWRRGEPHPASYDELYLNEEPNKGFVHVDVDRIGAGEPFVFNSGLIIEEAPEEGPISAPPIAGGGEVIQEWGVVRGSLRQRLVVPGVAKTRGAFGSEWATDLTIYNPLDEPQSVEVSFTASGAAASLVRKPQSVRLAAREIRHIEDVLNSLFLIAGAGGTLWLDPEVGVSVFARTYNRGDGGTAGFGMLALDFYNAASPRFPVTFSGAFPGTGFRTNVLVTDTSGRGAAVKLHVHGTGGKLATIEPAEATAPLGVRQQNVIAASGSALIVEPVRGSVMTSVVAVDNITNDATYFPPDLPAVIARSIPMIANLDHADGSPKLRSELYLLNPHDEARVVTLEAKVWDKPVRRIVTVRLEPRQARVIANPLQTLYGMFGIARLRYQGGVYVTSRTFTVRPGGGTYGTLVPALNNFQIAGPGDVLEILGVSGGDAFRTNLALIELSQANTFRTARLRVRVYDERNREIASFSDVLDSTYAKQIDDLFATHGIATPKAARIEVEVLADGLVASFATLEDKGTGDLTYLPANLGAKRP